MQSSVRPFEIHYWSGGASRAVSTAPLAWTTCTVPCRYFFFFDLLTRLTERREPWAGAVMLTLPRALTEACRSPASAGSVGAGAGRTDALYTALASRGKRERKQRRSQLTSLGVQPHARD
ncbi:hypothetical protein PVAP13_9NG651766 [Panicum virgatum]|uniref:Uncharacterized protein n=1 Tax=Panicum virgatum TaxID=38727 RepID=A0A8T0MZR5_PANVG|nr:hypothetical protein PVAP13_9NG651766 [Panicum virgatum]